MREWRLATGRRLRARARPPGSAPRLLACLAAIVALLVAAPIAGALPPGFTDQVVARIKASELAWTPDGRMLIGTKEGQVRVFKAGSLLPTPALDLSSRMCTNDERGLQGLAVHPNFTVNRHIYLYYLFNKFRQCTTTGGPAVNRLSRFVLGDDDRIDPSSETVLYESQQVGNGIHNGGNTVFGRDGNLYVTTGDGGSSGTARLAQDPGALLGKVLRLTDTGGIPSDNPFTGPDSARCNAGGRVPAGFAKCQEVYAMGFRNPFRGAVDPNAAGTRLFVNDVGAHTWEEVNDIVPNGNYGWPDREGPCGRDLDSGPSCVAPPPGITNPLHSYHQQPPNGGAITGAAFVPNGVWPPEYTGAYLYAEYVFGKIFMLLPKPGGGVIGSEFAQATLVTTLRFGPSGDGLALYYASRDNGGEIHRVTVSGGANRIPSAIALASARSGSLPLTVRFDGTASSDADGDPLLYTWDFGDGSPPVQGANPTHTYTSAATFHATLTVSDGVQASTAIVRVDPGNTAPEATIETPLESDTFAVGDAFTLRGRAIDADEGELPASALTWEVIRHHATHTHPFLEPTAGNEIPLTGPEPEDLDAARTSYLEIRLTATDSRGVESTVVRELRPRVVPLTFETTPPGLELRVGHVVMRGPTTLPSWERFAFPVDAPEQPLDGVTYRFGSWSDGGAAAHDVVTPAAATTYTAIFTLPPPVTGASVTPTVAPAPPPLALTIANLRALPRSFLASARTGCAGAARRTARCQRVPTLIGTRLRFALSAPARVSIQVVRPAASVCAGRAPARRCRTLGARSLGQIVAQGKAGANTVRLTGRVRGRALAPGTYELRVRAANATGTSRLARLRVIVLPN
jgi:glucose/arabinose dehydrogenase